MSQQRVVLVMQPMLRQNYRDKSDLNSVYNFIWQLGNQIYFIIVE